MIDRGADDRQAQGDVHRPAERRHLDRDQTLIVIAGDDRIELPAHRADEDRVRGERSTYVDPPTGTGLDRRTEHPLVFTAQQAMLSGVRVQTRETKPRRAHAET